MSYSPEQIQRVANMLRYSGTDEFSEEAADMLNDFATLHQQAARVDDDALLEIARDCGIRRHLHGVDATKAKRLLREFVTALEAALSAQPAQGVVGEVVAMRDAVGTCCGGIQARIAELEAAQPAERQGEAVEVIGLPGKSCAISKALPVGTRLYPGPQLRAAILEARRVWMDENPCEDGHDHVTPFDHLLYLHPAAPVGVPDGKCTRCNGTGEYIDYRGNMSQMETCYVCDGSGKAAATSAPQGVDRG